VVGKCILFSGMDAREREVIVDAMEEKKFGAVRAYVWRWPLRCVVSVHVWT